MALIDLKELFASARRKQDGAAMLAYQCIEQRMFRAMSVPGPNKGKPLNQRTIVRLIHEEIKDRQDSNEFLAPTQSDYGKNQHIITLLSKIVPR